MISVVRIAAIAVAAVISLFAGLFSTSARADIGAYVVVDAASGAVLAEKNMFQAWYPASITKLMTAYVTFRAMREGRIGPDSPVKITQNAASRPPSKMGFKVGTVLTVDTALKIIIVKSANDIAVALGEAVGGGSEGRFVDMMNAEARRLGMVATHFENPHGLPDDAQVTSARDMAVLARALLAEFPEHRDLFRITALQLGKRTIRTHNHLLERFRGTDGMKTGFICNSGFNVVTTTTRNGRTLIAVVLGAYTSAERNEFAAMLLTKAFGEPALRRGTLATLAPPAVTPAPVSVRDYTCGAKRKQRQQTAAAPAPAGEMEDDDGVIAEAGNRLIVANAAGAAAPAKPKSYLEARFSTMAPVPIKLGGATGTAVAVAVPMPPVRPRSGPEATPGPDPATLMALVPPTEVGTALPVASTAPPAPVVPAATAPPPPPLAEPLPGVPQPQAPGLGSIASAAQPGVSVPLSLIPTTAPADAAPAATAPAAAPVLGPRQPQN
ncbi:D-alanyl-D-alanine carboxypeptidase family protein [Pseudoxanthobacter sp. M-2]|uniref:D-alanyl-D-alanine carboxypeptidase family protein n=1 Tax=Pseudoxanthobacter sp. M-2 TaxID=3078754 RepID=UPI0038FC96CF